MPKDDLPQLPPYHN